MHGNSMELLGPYKRTQTAAFGTYFGGCQSRRRQEGAKVDISSIAITIAIAIAIEY